MNIKSMLKSFAVLTATTLLALGAQATDYYWIGGKSAKWAKGSSWSLTEGGEAAGAYPNGDADVAIFPDSADGAVIGAASVSVDSMAFGNAAVSFGNDVAIKVCTAVTNCIGCTGKILLTKEVHLRSNATVNTPIYVDIEVPEGEEGYIEPSATAGQVPLVYGKITGNGTLHLKNPVKNNYIGVHVYGDMSNFEGTVVVDEKNGNKAVRNCTILYDGDEDGWFYASNAVWNVYNSEKNNILDKNVNYSFGALNGRLYQDGKAITAGLIEVGALNQDCGLDGGNIYYAPVRKVGTAKFYCAAGHVGNVEIAGGTFEFQKDGKLGIISFTGNGEFLQNTNSTKDVSSLFRNSSDFPVVYNDGDTNRVWASAIEASNTAGFTKRGAGTVSMLKAPKYTGPTCVEAGTLAFPKGTTLPSTLAITEGAKVSVTGVLSGAEETLLTWTTDASVATPTASDFVIDTPENISVVVVEDGTTATLKAVVTATTYVWTGASEENTLWTNLDNWQHPDGSEATATPVQGNLVIFPKSLVDGATVTLNANTASDGFNFVFGCDTKFSGLNKQRIVYVNSVIGNGKILMDNVTLRTLTYAVVNYYNDIEVVSDSMLFARGAKGRNIVYGAITGSGKLTFDGDNGNNNQIYGDMSGFTGTLYNHYNLYLQNDKALNLAAATVDNASTIYFDAKCTESVLKAGALSGSGTIKNSTDRALTLEVGALNVNAESAALLSQNDGVGAWTVKKVGTGTQTFTDETVAYNVDLTAGELGVPNGKALGTVALNGGKFKFTIPESWTSGETNTLFTCESGVEAGKEVDYVTLDTSAFTDTYIADYDNTVANTLKVSFKSATMVWKGPAGGYWSDASNWTLGGEPVAEAPGENDSVSIGKDASIVVGYGQKFGAVMADSSAKLTVLFTAKDQTFTAPSSFAGTIDVAAPFTATEESGVYTAGARSDASYTWAGNDGVWTDAKNWRIDGKVTGVYPTAKDQALFNDISTVSLSSDVAISNLTFNADVVLTGPGHNLYNIYDIDGTGKIVMSNMTLKTKCTFEMDNDIEIAAGTDNVFYEGDNTYKTVTLNGNLSGSGYIQFQTYRRNTGFLFKGDNTAFSGTADLWDDNTKDNCWRGQTTFYNDKATSANAIWNIIQKGGTGWEGSDNTGALIYDEAGTNKFGALNGPIAYGGNYYNKTWEIGARNIDCACRINGTKANRNFDLVKVGTAKLTFSGQSFRDYIVCDGTLELDTVNAAPGGEIRFVGTGDEQGFVSFTESFTNTVDNSIYDLSSKIKNSTAAIGIDTAGFDVSWATAIKASNVGGLTKKGAGTLTIKKVALNGALQVLGGKIAVDEEVTAEGQELLSWDVVDGANEVSLSDFAFGTTPGGIGYAIVTNDTKVSLVTERVAATYGYQGADGGIWTDVANWNVDEKSTPYYPDEDDAAVIGENVTITTAVGQVVKTLMIDASSKLAFDLSSIAKNEAVTLFTVGEGTPLAKANVLFSGYDETKYYLAVTEGEAAMTVGLYDLTKFVWTGKGGDTLFGTPGNWAYGVENGPTAEDYPKATGTLIFPESFTEGVTVEFDKEYYRNGNNCKFTSDIVLDCNVTFASTSATKHTIGLTSATGTGSLALSYIELRTSTGYKYGHIDVPLTINNEVSMYLRGENANYTINAEILGNGTLRLEGDSNPSKNYYLKGDMQNFSGALYSAYAMSSKKGECITTHFYPASLNLGKATYEVVGRVYVEGLTEAATMTVGALVGTATTGRIYNETTYPITLVVGNDDDASSSVKLTGDGEYGAWSITKVGTGTQTLTADELWEGKTLVNVEAGALVLPASAPFTLGASTHYTIVGDTRVFTNGTPNKPVMIFVR